MHDLTDILGRGKILKNMNETLKAEKNCMVILHGPSGSGKTALASVNGENWIQNGGSCLSVKGDNGRTGRDYFPFYYSLQPLQRRFTRLSAEHGRRLASALSTTAGMFASGAFIPQTITDSIIALMSTDLKEKMPYLSDDDVAIIQKIKKHAGENPILLIADDYHVWDSRSKDLLCFLHENKMRDHISPFHDLRSIITVESEGSARKLKQYLQRNSDATVRIQKLNLCTFQQFISVLKFHNIERSLDEEKKKQLYSLCGGHFAVINVIVSEFINGNVDRLYHSDDFEDLVRRSLDARLSNDEMDFSALRRLLEDGAQIGTTFTESELRCLARRPETQVRADIKSAERLGLVQNLGERICFNHSVFHKIFHEHGKHNQYEVLERYFDCLKITSPGAYALRSDIADVLGHHELAAIFAAVESIKLKRNASEGAQSLSPKLSSRISDQNLRDFVSQMHEGYGLFRRSEYSRGLKFVQSISVLRFRVLQGERSFLESLFLMEQEDDESVSGALKKADLGIHHFQDEFELCVRFLMLKQQILVLQGRIEAARETESECINLLLERSWYDHDANVKLAILERKADALYEAEVSVRKVKRAKNFFESLLEVSSPSLPIEYVRSMNNLLAVYIKLGQKHDAIQTSEQLQAYLHQNPEVIVPRIDVILNNTIIAALEGGLNPGEAGRLMTQVANSEHAKGENSIHWLNAAAIFTRAGGIPEARKILNMLAPKLLNREITEHYIVYFFQVNLVNILFHEGFVNDAGEEADNLERYVRSLEWPNKSMIVKRCEHLRRAIAGIRPGDVSSWQKYFEEINSDEPTWKYYGRAFPLCELQYWSEM